LNLEFAAQFGLHGLAMTGDASGRIGRLASAPLADALASLTDMVRAKPNDLKQRVYLVQLLCAMGQWSRAHNQLTVAAELDASAIPMKQVYADAILGESFRADVFAGKRSPMLFGEPSEWIAMLIESLLQMGKGGIALSLDLRAKAFELAPSSIGTINSERFDWICDGDMRLGPVLEAYVNGRYYWIPFDRLQSIKIEAPEDLRDYVWTPAHLQFSNGGETLALIPSRYPGSEQSTDQHIQLALKTEWIAQASEVFSGFGQRSFSTNIGEHALLDTREIHFTQT
jgi:type VI secretion system protein ImpE